MLGDLELINSFTVMPEDIEKVVTLRNDNLPGGDVDVHELIIAHFGWDEDKIMCVCRRFNALMALMANDSLPGVGVLLDDDAGVITVSVCACAAKAQMKYKDGEFYFEKAAFRDCTTISPSLREALSGCSPEEIEQVLKM